MAFCNGVQTDVTLPGGWVYPQALRDGQSVRIDGHGGYGQLVNAILAFRLRQLDVVDPERASPAAVAEDVRAYVCAHFPAWCAKPLGEYVSPPAPSFFSPQRSTPYRTPIDRVLEWLPSLKSSPTGFVEPSRAAARATVCAGCRFNIDWQTPCGPCIAEVRRLALVAKGTRATPYDGRLGACRAFGHLNSVAVWLAEPGGEAAHDPPGTCWRLA